MDKTPARPCRARRKYRLLKNNLLAFQKNLKLRKKNTVKGNLQIPVKSGCVKLMKKNTVKERKIGLLHTMQFLHFCTYQLVRKNPLLSEPYRPTWLSKLSLIQHSKP